MMSSSFLHSLFGIQAFLPWMFGTVLMAVCVSLAFRILHWFATKRASLLNLKDVAVPPKHWLFGHILAISPEVILGNVRVWVREVHHKVFQLWLGPGILTTLHLHHPDNLKPLFSTAEPKGDIYDMMKSWIGEGLIVSHGSRWARDRRLLTPAFHFDILKHYLHTVNQSVIKALEHWKELALTKNEPLEMLDNVSAMTLDTLLKCTFGVDCDQEIEDTQHYCQCVQQLTELAVKRVLAPHLHFDILYYLTADGRRWKHNCDFVHAFSKKFIVKRREILQNSQLVKDDTEKRKHLDFLDMLLSARDEDGNGMSDKEIQEQVDTFMFAGHDTTASAISFCLYNLASHQNYQEMCREEVKQILQGRSQIMWDDLSKLSFLTMCIKESLRIDSTVPGINRKLTRPLKLDDRVYEAGTWISVSLYGLHHNPSVWTDPEVFDPMRFSEENTMKRPPHAFTPFSAGPRNCIGQQFAMNELKVAVALTLLRFHLEPVSEKPCLRVPKVVMRASSGVWIKLTPLK